MHQVLPHLRARLSSSRIQPWHAVPSLSGAFRVHGRLPVKPTSPSRAYATVSKSTICLRPPQEALVEPSPFSKDINDFNFHPRDFLSRLIDEAVLHAVTSSRRESTSLRDIIEQYLARSGTVLDVSLPYEAQPSEVRRVFKSDNGSKAELQSDSNVILIAHCAMIGGEHKITLSSGFALNIARERVGGEAVILTCAHTLEEIRQWPRLMGTKFSSDSELQQSGSFVIIGGLNSLEVFPISKVLSALPRSDLLLLSCSLPEAKIKPLPVSPYPAHKTTSIQAHLVRHEQPNLDTTWRPWIGDSLGKWEDGKIAGYRDFAGGEAQPGTYDALSHLFFTPIPTAGSSGGPIVDKETGAVVGVILGSRMNNRVEGVLGWGVPSETIFEMFALPGLEGKK